MISSRKQRQEYELLQKKYLRVMQEKEELEYRLESLQEKTAYAEEQDAEIRALHQNARKLKHDMKNHLMVIASYLNGCDYEAAKNYISDILDKLNSMHSYIETGNSLMNHILNEKFTIAKGHGIAVKAEIENLSFARLKSIDFSAVLSNLLDNAIEASLQERTIFAPDAGISEEAFSPEMEVVIQKRKGYETICVKNKISQSVLKSNPNLQSTKADKDFHGIGLPQIKQIVEACGGMYDFYEEDDFFCVNVFIPE